MEETIKLLIDKTAMVAALVGAVLTVAAAFVSGLASRGEKKKAFLPEMSESERGHVRTRIDEAIASLERQEAVAKRNEWASSLLIFGQYVIGGALASSFIQESLSKPIVGTLGVLVLLSSLIHQRYRPDIKVRGAKDRIVRLRSLIREAQDDFNSYTVGKQGAPSMDKIIRKISRGLNEVESLEMRDTDELIRETKALAGNGDT